MAEIANAGRPRTARGRGTPTHRTTADVALKSNSALCLPTDTPGIQILISAAVETMSEKGFHGTSVRDIAERAGMSPAVLYHYFGSKQDLLAAIMHRCIDHLIERCREAYRVGPADPVSRLYRLVREHVLVHTELRRETLLGASEVHSVEEPQRSLLLGKRDEHERLFHQVVDDGVRAGAFATPFPAEAVRGMLTMSTGVSVWFRADGPLPAAAVADRFGRLALAMLESRAEPAPDGRLSEVRLSELQASELQASELQAAELRAPELRPSDVQSSDLQSPDLQPSRLGLEPRSEPQPGH